MHSAFSNGFSLIVLYSYLAHSVTAFIWYIEITHARLPYNKNKDAIEKILKKYSCSIVPISLLFPSHPLPSFPPGL